MIIGFIGVGIGIGVGIEAVGERPTQLWLSVFYRTRYRYRPRHRWPEQEYTQNVLNSYE